MIDLFIMVGLFILTGIGCLYLIFFIVGLFCWYSDERDLHIKDKYERGEL